MRQLGTLESETEARRLADYLLTQDISTMVEADNGHYAIWVREENQVESAREIFHRFLEDPERPEYRQAAKQAGKLRSEEEKRQKQAQKNYIQASQVMGRPLSRRAPVTFGLILISVAVSIGTGFGRQYEPVGQYFFFAMYEHPQTGEKYVPKKSFLSIRQGELWRLFTPMFVHMSIIHLVFNLYWLYRLGVQVEDKVGWWRYLLLILFCCAAANFAQAYFVHAKFGGMSGVLYGLFGFIVTRMYLSPWSGYYLDQMTIVILFGWFVLCIVFQGQGPFSSVANYAHGGGLLAGGVLGLVPQVFGGGRTRGTA